MPRVRPLPELLVVAPAGYRMSTQEDAGGRVTVYPVRHATAARLGVLVRELEAVARRANFCRLHPDVAGGHTSAARAEYDRMWASMLVGRLSGLREGQYADLNAGPGKTEADCFLRAGVVDVLAPRARHGAEFADLRSAANAEAAAALDGYLTELMAPINGADPAQLRGFEGWVGAHHDMLERAAECATPGSDTARRLYTVVLHPAVALPRVPLARVARRTSRRWFRPPGGEAGRPSH